MAGESVIKAFLKGNNKRVKNDESLDYDLYLHGNKIAEFTMHGEIYITNAGYFTNVTKDRLNQLGANITQKNKIWYKDGIEWDGKWIKL